MDSNLRREIIVDNYQNPTNKKRIDDETFLMETTKSESCIDNIDLYVKFDGNTIKDMYFDGEACAITTSATSIMIQMFIGKKIEDAINIINNYENMLNEKQYDQELLKDLNAYDEIYKQPNRKKCALFPFETFKKILEKYSNLNN